MIGWLLRGHDSKKVDFSTMLRVNFLIGTTFLLIKKKIWIKLISYCWFNPQPMRKDHSIAGTAILQTTLENADNTQFYWWYDKSGDKGSSWTLRRFGVQHHCQSSAMNSREEWESLAMKGRVSNLLFLSWLMTDDGVEHRNVLKSNYYLCHWICHTINKIVYYQHLLVSFEELLSLWVSDPFALVVGWINNNWLNLWKRCVQGVQRHFASSLNQINTKNY